MKKILVWDNNGTIVAQRTPNDTKKYEKVILPGVAQKMATADLNVIISGFASPESEKQNFDPKKIIKGFTTLMEQLPISAVAFSPAIGGVACYIMVKTAAGIETIEAHKDPRYASYVGQFKKPGIGMFVVMRGIIADFFGMELAAENATMIGDTWHDEHAAQEFGIPFLSAEKVHAEK